MDTKNNIFLRRAFLLILKKWFNRTGKIKHHYTQDDFSLNYYKHKGYWFYGKKRESETMQAFTKLIDKNDVVIEIGAHIGYLSLYFAQLVEEGGKVVVFEPGINNLSILKKNIASYRNIQLIEKAVSNENGEVSFYIDDITGQNNSLNADYEVFKANQKYAVDNVGYKEVKVEAVRFDDFVRNSTLQIDFIKIDVEGAELLVLEGMSDTLQKQLPILMIEVTNNRKEIVEMMHNLNYHMYDPKGERLSDDAELNFNTFFLHARKHANLIDIFAV